MKEIFKNVKDYEGLYQISNLGRVKSFVKWRGQPERILKGRPDKKGYLNVILYKNKKSKNFRIHKLVALNFLKHGPYNLVVDHINNIKTDNRLNNLQLITNRLNISKDVKNKTSKYTGVSYDKKNKKWRASISINKKQINLGRYNTQELARDKYINALNKLNE
jgi:hypothetical protein